MTETTDRILEIMKQHSESAYSLETKTGLPISTVSSWKSGRFKPSADAVVKVAQHYNVSTDYLLCLNDDPTPLQTTEIVEKQNAFVLTDLSELLHEKRFIKIAKMYKALPNDKREQVYGFIQGVVTTLEIDINKILGR